MSSSESDKKYRLKNIDYYKKYRKEYNLKNKEKIKQLNKDYRKKHRDRLVQYSKDYYKNNKKEFIEKYGDNAWYYANPEKSKKIRADYYQKNKKKILKRRLERYKTDVQYKLAAKLRGRFKDEIKKYKTKKVASVMDIVGCSMDDLKIYLEKNFISGMTWENHGKIWHIDHILPISNFDLTCEEEQIKCFHYTNLQPLLKRDNLSKNCKIQSDFINGHRLWDGMCWVVGVYAG